MRTMVMMLLALALCMAAPDAPVGWTGGEGGKEPVKIVSPISGICAIVKESAGKVMIAEVLPKGPAEGAGIKPDDTIVGINDLSTEGMDVTEVITLLRGQEGTTVAVTVTRDGGVAPMRFVMTREPIPMRDIFPVR